MPEQVKLREKAERPTTPCWQWPKKLNEYGYGRWVRRGPHYNRPAHRVIWEFFRGPFPDGLEPDHLCRNRGCVRPDHLDPVTGRENRIRGTGWVGVNFRKTECKRGHAFTAENTVRRKSGTRGCRECGRRDARESKRRRKAALLQEGR